VFLVSLYAISQRYHLASMSSYLSAQQLQLRDSGGLEFPASLRLSRIIAVFIVVGPPNCDFLGSVDSQVIHLSLLSLDVPPSHLTCEPFQIHLASQLHTQRLLHCHTTIIDHGRESRISESIDRSINSVSSLDFLGDFIPLSMSRPGYSIRYGNTRY
jgi:hypothetical protein